MIHVRWIMRRDTAIVVDICEALGFEETNDSLLLRLKQASTIGMVAEFDYTEVVGFMIYDLSRNSITLTHFAVHPDFHGVGVSDELLERLKSKLNQIRTKLYMRIGLENLHALNCFKRNGFEAISLKDDIVTMRYLKPVRQGLC